MVKTRSCCASRMRRPRVVGVIGTCYCSSTSFFEIAQLKRRAAGAPVRKSIPRSPRESPARRRRRPAERRRDRRRSRPGKRRAPFRRLPSRLLSGRAPLVPLFPHVYAHTSPISSGLVALQQSSDDRMRGALSKLLKFRMATGNRVETNCRLTKARSAAPGREDGRKVRTASDEAPTRATMLGGWFRQWRDAAPNRGGAGNALPTRSRRRRSILADRAGAPSDCGAKIRGGS
jgi:hypothetical protein